MCRGGEWVSNLSTHAQPGQRAETQASTPQAELTMHVWDLNKNQLWEVLEALQPKTAQREGTAPYWGCPREIQGSLEVAVKL